MSFTEALGTVFAIVPLSILVAFSILFILCSEQLLLHIDPDEPPLLKPKIPVVGHIIGILWHQSVYLEKLSAENRRPIVTLPMVKRKIYLVTSPALLQSIFRAPNLSFEPFVIEFSARSLGLYADALKILRAGGDGSALGCVREIVKVTHEGFLGGNLHKMIATSLDHISTTINALQPVTDTHNLYDWLQTTVTLATGRAFYGKHDPLHRDPSLFDSLRKFNDGIVALLVDVFPRILAPRAYRALTALQTAFGTYYRNKYDQEQDVSSFVKVRAALYRRNGMDPTDIGKREAMIRAAETNIVSLSFFVLLFLSQDAVVAEFVRLEIQAAIVITTAEEGQKVATFNVSKLPTLCPLLVSSYHETQRLVNSNVITRRALKDTVISDGNSKYLLRAGADVQIPVGTFHLSTIVWGPDAAEFNFKRFLKSEATGEAAKEVEKEHKRAYLPFGGGKSPCPGQQYASAQVLALVAVLLVGFDISGEDGALLQMPEIVRSRLGQAISRPSKKGMMMGARLTRREGWENVQWKFVQNEDDRSAVRGENDDKD